MELYSPSNAHIGLIPGAHYKLISKKKKKPNPNHRLFLTQTLSLGSPSLSSSLSHIDALVASHLSPSLSHTNVFLALHLSPHLASYSMPRLLVNYLVFFCLDSKAFTVFLPHDVFSFVWFSRFNRSHHLSLWFSRCKLSKVS